MDSPYIFQIPIKNNIIPIIHQKLVTKYKSFIFFILGTYFGTLYVLQLHFIFRLWAEVFHVSAKGEEIKWQQISEDLVPVNITCLQDGPEYIFHITAYNSQVEKIMDIRLVQPGI